VLVDSKSKDICIRMWANLNLKSRGTPTFFEIMACIFKRDELSGAVCRGVAIGILGPGRNWETKLMHTAVNPRMCGAPFPQKLPFFMENATFLLCQAHFHISMDPISLSIMS
jgi:hypothetical protein